MSLEWIYILNSPELGELQLTHSPIGWDGAEFILKRSKDFEGVFNNYSINELEFTGNGYIYFKTLFNAIGIGFECTITVKRFNQSLQLYDDVYVGILNGRTYKLSSKNGKSVLLKVGESSVQENILARVDNVINYDDERSINGLTLPTLANKYSNLHLSGVEITTTANGGFQAGSTQLFYGNNKICSLFFESNNENIGNPLYALVPDLTKMPDGGWVYQTYGRTSKINIKLSASFIVNLITAFSVVIAKGTKLNPTDINDTNYLSNITTLSSTNVTRFFPNINIDEDIELLENETLFIYFRQFLPTSSDEYITINESSSISFNISELPTTKTIQAIQPYNLFSRILSSITDNKTTLESELFALDNQNNGWGTVMHFNGYMARGFSDADSSFAISLKKMFDSWKILANCALGINENTVTIERRSEFYKDEIILTIDNVKQKTFEKYIKEDLFITNIESGYNKTEYEEDSGLEEYNNKSEYSTPIDNTKGKLQLTPSLRADPYGITFAIDKPKDETETTDTKFDKENFICDSTKIGIAVISYVQKNYRNSWTVNGIDQITTPMNLDFTPAKILIRNSDKLTGIDKSPTIPIKFNKSDVVNDLATKSQFDSYFVEENKDIEQSKLNSQLKSGFEVIFDWALTFAQFAYLKNNRYGLIKVKNPITDEYNLCWIEEIKLNKNNEASFRLHEKYGGVQPITDTVMVDHNDDYVVTDDYEKISVL